MARQVYGIKNSEGVVFIDKKTNAVVEKVAVAEAVGGWIAASEDGKVYGKRHESKRAARDYVSDSLGLVVHYLSEGHPAVRGLLARAVV